MLRFLQLLKLKIRIGILLMTFFVFSSAKSPLPLFAKEGEFFAKHKDGRFIFTVINIKYANGCDK